MSQRAPIRDLLVESVEFYKSHYEQSVIRQAKRPRDVANIFNTKRARAGKRYIAPLREALCSLSLERSEMQIQFHEAFMRACFFPACPIATCPMPHEQQAGLNCPLTHFT